MSRSLKEHRRRAGAEPRRQHARRSAGGNDATEPRQRQRRRPLAKERHGRPVLQHGRCAGDGLLEVVDLDRPAACAVLGGDQLIVLAVLFIAAAPGGRGFGAARLDDLFAAGTRSVVAKTEGQQDPARHAQGGQQKEEQDLDASERLQGEREAGRHPDP